MITLHSVQGHARLTLFDFMSKIKNGGLDQYGTEHFGRLEKMWD